MQLKNESIYLWYLVLATKKVQSSSSAVTYDDVDSGRLFEPAHNDINVRRLSKLCNNLEADIQKSRENILSDRYSTFIDEFKEIGFIGLGTLALTYSSVSSFINS